MSPSPVWFITASSSGFGHALALEALKREHTVIATARNTDKIKDLKDAGAHTLTFDVTAPLATIEVTARDIEQQFGRVDYLVNVAGYILDAAIEEATPEEVQQQFNTNVFGTVNTIRAFLPMMRDQALPASGGARGTVVTFGSLGSWIGAATFGFYSMTKWCMSALAESLRAELQPFNIVATTVEPGYFRTSVLNPGVRILSKKRMDVYEDISTPSGQARRVLDAADGNQLGDVNKGAKVVVDVLTRTGVADSKEVPVRIPLGSDCDQTIRDKCETTTKLLDRWAPVIKSTDYPQGK